MPARRIRWTRLALADLAAARERIESDSPAAWKKLASQVRAGLASPQRNPRLGRVVPEREAQGYRELQIPPYRLVYAIAGSELHVLRFWHARRAPASM